MAQIELDLDDTNDYLGKIMKEKQEVTPLTEKELLKCRGLSEELLRKQEIYYYILRNSINIILEPGDNLEKIKEREKKLFDSLKNHAIYMASQNHMVKDLPFWINNVFHDITNHITDTYILKKAGSLTIVPYLDDGIIITVDSEKKMYLPLILKTFLKNYLSRLFVIIDTWNENQDKNDKAIFDALFPFFLYYTNPSEVRLTTLPRYRMTDIEKYNKIKRLAHYQILFFVLHEIGHIACGHNEPEERKQQVLFDGFDTLFTEDKEEHYNEYEADAIATSLLLAFPEDQQKEICLAIRILMKFYSTLTAFDSYLSTGTKKNPGNNIFEKRNKVLLTIPGGKNQEENTKTLMTVIHIIFDRFLTILYTSEKKIIEEKRAFYGNEKNNNPEQNFNSAIEMINKIT